MRAAIAILAVIAAALPLAAQIEHLGGKLKDLAFDKKVAEARALAEAERVHRPALDPAILMALSWVARGASFAEQWEVAQTYARETHELASRIAAKEGVDSSPDLATALGASIEVLGAAYGAVGDGEQAVAFLKAEREKYRGSSIETRIQKNVHLASLEGTAMPDLAPDLYLGDAAPMSTEGKVTVYYFWAHWCRSSKRQKPDLITLHERYANKGLAVVGPTTLFGYTSSRQVSATREQEIAYVEGEWQQETPLPEWMPRPLRDDMFVEFGVSSTPTIIITDRGGVVRLYHPGLMTLAELEEAVKPLL